MGYHMTDISQNPESADRQERETVVSTDEFSSVDAEAPIRDSRNVDCRSIARLYAEAVQKENGNETAVRVFGFLEDVTRIGFNPKGGSSPYVPWLVGEEGKRTIIPDDLESEQFAEIEKMVPGIQNPGLRARLADIVWLNDRTRADMARRAITAYCEAIRLVLDRKARFQHEEKVASGFDGRDSLLRACQITKETGWKDSEVSTLKALVHDVINDSIKREHHRGLLNIAEVTLRFEIDDDRTRIAEAAETFADSSDIHPDCSRNLWTLAAEIHSRSGNTGDKNRCLIKAAETHVTLAETSESKLVAASSLMDAIKELQRLPNTRQQRQELDGKLRAAQLSRRDEMGVLPITLDVTRIAKEARQIVGGLSIEEALERFSALEQSPHPESLWAGARRQAEENLFSSMTPHDIVDGEGKVVDRSPTYCGSKDDREKHLRHRVLENERWRRLLAVAAIEPARQLIMSEHQVNGDALRSMVETCPFIPDDRTDLVTQGLTKFFEGDFASALHVLVPQLEHSLRHILKRAAIEPSVIRPKDMTQENSTLPMMLKNERKPLESALGPAIVFEIENLFLHKGGPAFRHKVAHGLLSSDECRSTDSIYACWFMYRLCCLRIGTDPIPAEPNENRVTAS